MEKYVIPGMIGLINVLVAMYLLATISCCLVSLWENDDASDKTLYVYRILNRLIPFISFDRDIAFCEYAHGYDPIPSLQRAIAYDPHDDHAIALYTILMNHKESIVPDSPRL